MTHPDPTESFRFMKLDGNNHDELLFRPSTSFTSFAGTSDICFINLYFSNQFCAIWSDHRLSEFMQHCPRCLLTAQSQYTLKTKCADSQLLVSDVPGSGKPQLEWRSCFIQNHSRSNRCSAITPRAFP